MKRGLVILALVFGSRSGLAGPTAEEAHKQAARELCEVIGIKRTMQAAEGAILPSMFKANPDLVAYQDVVRKWFKQVIDSGDIEAQYATIYEEQFTESELRSLVGFFKSAIGQRYLGALPDLMRRGAELAQQKLQEHLPDLNAMVAARKKELEKGSR